jgi:hypothetical protein
MQHSTDERKRKELSGDSVTTEGSDSGKKRKGGQIPGGENWMEEVKLMPGVLPYDGHDMWNAVAQKCNQECGDSELSRHRDACRKKFKEY